MILRRRFLEKAKRKKRIKRKRLRHHTPIRSMLFFVGRQVSVSAFFYIYFLPIILFSNFKKFLNFFFFLFIYLRKLLHDSYPPIHHPNGRASHFIICFLSFSFFIFPLFVFFLFFFFIPCLFKSRSRAIHDGRMSSKECRGMRRDPACLCVCRVSYT